MLRRHAYGVLCHPESREAIQWPMVLSVAIAGFRVQERASLKAMMQFLVTFISRSVDKSGSVRWLFKSL
jgi:hypothetical protein